MTRWPRSVSSRQRRSPLERRGLVGPVVVALLEHGGFRVVERRGVLSSAVRRVNRVQRSQVGAGPWTRCTIAEITRYTPNAPAASTTIVRPYRESQPFTVVTTRIVGSGATAWARTGISMASM